MRASAPWRTLMSKLPLSEGSVTVTRNVDWLPGLPVVELRMVGKFKEIPDEEALTRFNINVDMFARFAKECCLREIVEAGIKCKVCPGVEPGRLPARVRSLGSDLEMDCHVTPISRENAEDILHVDQLESILRGAMYKQIRREQSKT